MSTFLPDALVLAFYPCSRGFAYVLFEGPLSPYDWAVKEVRGTGKNARILAQMKQIIARYSPLVIVVEDWTDEWCRRAPRIKRLYESLIALAKEETVQFVRHSTQEIKQAFAQVMPCTKYEIALAIAKHIPVFSFQLPPARKIWMSEDPRQSLYDAAALGLTHYRLSLGTQQ